MEVKILKTYPRSTFIGTDYLAKFTSAERSAMRTSNVPEVYDVYDMFRAMVIVDINSQFVIDSIQVLVDNEIITPERGEIMLEGEYVN